MALIKCPECGNEISDKESACSNCGCPIEQIIRDEQKEAEKIKEQQLDLKQKKSRRNQKIKPIYIIIIAIFIFLVILIVVFLNKENKYNNAVNAYENGDYQIAYNYFKNSEYKDSKSYREKSVVEYARALINSNEFENADVLINEISDKAVCDELKSELVYAKAIEYYHVGEFELAYNILSEMQESDDVESYLKNAEMMMNIQGEWSLSGTKVFAQKDINFAALKINGWNAELLYCTDGDKTYESVGRCKLEMKGTAEAYLKIGTTEYKILSRRDGSGKLCVLAEIKNDDFLEKYKTTTNDKYVWNHFGDMSLSAFEKIKGSIPTKPEIGMTAEEVRNGSWGEPNDINKDTYSWGVKEQWCYSENRYVYLENGVVTAISE